MLINHRTYVIFFLSALIFSGLSVLLYYQIPDIQAHLEIDSTGYDAIAQYFYHTNKLINPLDHTSAPIQPVGYPFFLGLMYKLFGINYAAVIAIHVVLCLITAWLLARIAIIVFDNSIAQIVLILFSIHIGFLVYAQLILAEILLVTFLVAFWERLITFIKSHSLAHAGQTGLLLGLSILIKPIALLYIFPLIVIVWFFFTEGYQQKVTYVAALVCSFYVPIAAYMMYNYFLYNVFALAPMFHLNMYQCFLSKVIARIERIPIHEVINNLLFFKGAHSFDYAGWDHARTLFLDYFKSYPVTFFTIWFENVIKTLAGLFTTQLKVLANPNFTGGDCSFFNIEGTLFERLYTYITFGSPAYWVSIIGCAEAVWSIVRYLCACFALLVLYIERNYAIGILFVSFIVLCALATGIDGCCRYRMAFEPLLMLLTAFGIKNIYLLVKIYRSGHTTANMLDGMLPISKRTAI